MLLYKNICLKYQNLQENKMENLQNIENLDVNKLIKFTQSIIEFDNTALIEQVKGMVAKFNGLIITEEMLPEIKKDRATLNKVAKSFDDIRKDIKNKYNQPLAHFEGKIKEICLILDSQVKEFDAQTECFELKRKKDKRQLVERIIQDVCMRKELDEDKYSSQLTFIDKYYNVTETDVKIIKDLEQRADVILIQQKNDEMAEQLRNMKIKNREMIIEKINLETTSSFKYSDFTIEKYAEDKTAVEAMHNEITMRTDADKRQAAIIEKRSINVAITEQTHNNITVDYIEVRIYADSNKVTDILKKEGLQYNIINEGKKVIRSESLESPF